MQGGVCGWQQAPRRGPRNPEPPPWVCPTPQPSQPAPASLCPQEVLQQKHLGWEMGVSGEVEKRSQRPGRRSLPPPAQPFHLGGSVDPGPEPSSGKGEEWRRGGQLAGRRQGPGLPLRPPSLPVVPQFPGDTASPCQPSSCIPNEPRDSKGVLLPRALDR